MTHSAGPRAACIRTALPPSRFDAPWTLLVPSSTAAVPAAGAVAQQGCYRMCRRSRKENALVDAPCNGGV